MLSGSLHSLARKFPAVYHPEIIGSLERIQFQVELVTARVGKGADLLDLGGGNGFFGAACVQAGLKATVVDDYKDNTVDHSELWRTLESLGVTLCRADFMSSWLALEADSLDVVTSFDVLEHLHGSPKPVLHTLRDSLRSSGLFVIGVPNAVNLRKRVSVFFGKSNWSQFSEWYDKPVFRSHVREPVRADLERIGDDLNLSDVEIIGRNFAGSISPNRITQFVTPFADRLLRLKPSFCSDLYMVGRG